MRQSPYPISILAVTLALLAPGRNGIAQITGVPKGITGATVLTGPHGPQGVKAVPYSADDVVETTQLLSDGNRIVRKATGRIYRDSEGRTRRERPVLRSPATSVTPDDAPRHVTINDPVARIHYVLDPLRKTARKFSFPSQPERVSRTKTGAPPPPSARTVTERRQITTEPLGTETIEGLEAQGTRHTITIPAGQQGNDLPIQLIDEQWYSPALREVVLSKHNDPRFGETVSRLTNISLEEPDASLFEIPPDYTVEELQPVNKPDSVP